MPRRSVLSAAERENLLAWPETQDQLIRHYLFSEADLVLIRQHRGEANRLGFAVQLCAMRDPGVALPAGQAPPTYLLAWVAAQVQVLAQAWDEYGQRDQTRREHQAQLQSAFGFSAFARHHYRWALQELDALAFQTDKGILLATELIERLRSRLILLPPVAVIERFAPN